MSDNNQGQNFPYDFNEIHENIKVTNHIEDNCLRFILAWDEQYIGILDGLWKKFQLITRKTMPDANNTESRLLIWDDILQRLTFGILDGPHIRFKGKLAKAEFLKIYCYDNENGEYERVTTKYNSRHPNAITLQHKCTPGDLCYNVDELKVGFKRFGISLPSKLFPPIEKTEKKDINFIFESTEKPEEYFPDLRIHFLKIQANRWVKRYNEAPIQRVLLCSFSSPYEGIMSEQRLPSEPMPIKYAVVFEVDAKDKTVDMDQDEMDEYRNADLTGQRSLESYERLLDATGEYKNGHIKILNLNFITADFERVYNKQTSINEFIEEWIFRIKFNNRDWDSRIKTDEQHVVLFGKAQGNLGVGESSPEEQIQKIEVGYENDYEFKIKMPRKSSKPCTWAALGCRNERTEEFKKILEVIQEGYITLNDPKKKKAFRIGCKKLSAYIKKEYIPSLPDGFKIYEKIDKTTYKLIFKKMEEPDFDPTKKIKGMSKDELLQELQRLIEEKMPHYIIDVKNQKDWKSKQDTKKANVAKNAMDKGASDEDINDIILKKTEVEILTDDAINKKVPEGHYFDEGLQKI